MLETWLAMKIALFGVELLEPYGLPADASELDACGCKPDSDAIEQAGISSDDSVRKTEQSRGG